MPVNMRQKTLTLSQWGDIAELAIDALTNGHAGELLTQEETTATLELLESIGHWQQYFMVDGDSAANELCGVDIPDGLPFRIELVGP